MITGCGTAGVDLRDHLDLYRTSPKEKLAAKHASLKEFLACTRQPHDTASTPPVGTASPNDGAVDEPDMSVRPITALIERVRAKLPQRGESLSVFQTLLTDREWSSQRRLDLGTLRQIVEVVRQWQVHLDFDEDALRDDASRFGRLLLAYNKAYFGDVEYVPDPNPPNTGIHGLVKVTSAGFVDRNGNVWSFPGLSLDTKKTIGQRTTITASSVDSQQVSAGLTRVFLEAFFDAAFRVPAFHGATALTVSGPDGEAYPEFDAAHLPIPLDAIARVTRDALRAEAAVTSLVGKAVRGGSLFGTNNETVAATMETAAGVIAKKLAEHEGLCYYQIVGRSPRIATTDADGLIAH